MGETSDDMMNPPKSLHGEGMSIDGMMNMTLTRSP